jgi:acyl-CoA thioesterase-2
MDAFVRADVPAEAVAAAAAGAPRAGGGRVVAWMRTAAELGDPADVRAQLVHRCWLAYMSDDLPFDAVRQIHPSSADPDFHERSYGASLDHTMWFHRPMRADRWHLHDISCHAFGGARGLTLAHVFAEDGAHVATYAQEILLRDPGPAR